MTLQKRSEDVYRGLILSFRAFGGIPKELLFDNMATAAITTGPKKRINPGLARFAKDFGFKVQLCGTRMPQTKGSVVARNKILDWIRSYDGEFEDLKELMDILDKINKEMNIQIIDAIGMSPTALFYKEKEYLQPLPVAAIIDSYLQARRFKVAKDALIRFNGSKYSVDPRYIGEDVSAETLDDYLYIYYKGKLITFHPLNSIFVNYKLEEIGKAI